MEYLRNEALAFPAMVMYEARSSVFKAGVAELLIDEGRKLMAELA